MYLIKCRSLKLLNVFIKLKLLLLWKLSCTITLATIKAVQAWQLFLLVILFNKAVTNIVTALLESIVELLKLICVIIIVV